MLASGMVVMPSLIILSNHFIFILIGSNLLFLVPLFVPSAVAMLSGTGDKGYHKAFLIPTAFSCFTENDTKQPKMFLLT